MAIKDQPTNLGKVYEPVGGEPTNPSPYNSHPKQPFGASGGSPANPSPYNSHPLASALGWVTSTVKWLLTNVLNLGATIGESAVNAGGPDTTYCRVYDDTSGLLIEGVPEECTEGMRVSYDTDEGATRGGELVDAQTAATWVAQGTNTVEDDGDEVKITYVDNTAGAALVLRDIVALSEDFVVGSTYVVSGYARVNSGSSVGILTINPVQVADESPITDTTKTPFTITIVATSASTCQLRTTGLGAGEIIWFSDVSVKGITPIFLNSVSKSDATLLHPVKTGDHGEEIYLLYDYRQNSEVVTAGDHRYIVGTDNHNYAITCTTGGTTHTAAPAVAKTDLGSTVTETGGVVWSVDSHYSNIADETDNHMPHVLSVPFPVTNYLLNSDAPATQTTGSLGTGDYNLSQDGTGSSDLTAGTATISAAGSATDGSDFQCTVTVAGTVTVTVVGGPPDRFQLNDGDYRPVYVPTAGSTVTRTADSFISAQIPESGKMRWQLALENLDAQTPFSDGTNELTYTGTAIEFTDGVATLSHIVTPEHGDFVGLNEETGEFYYNGILVDTDGTLAVTWGTITAINNVVQITDDAGLDLTDTAWSQP